jgi:dTDP-glucose 4,6-dehydratase
MLPVDPEIAMACRNSNTREGLREIAPQPSDAVAGQRLARQWFQYYGLPMINVSVPNIFGPEQNRDQFFPAIIETLSEKKPLRLAQGRRRWAFVEDIVDAIVHVARHGQAGEHYRVDCDKGDQSDIEMAQLICDQLDQLTPCASGSYRDYVQATLSNSMAVYVEPSMLELGTSLGWQPLNDFHCSLAATVRQYIT